MANAEYGLSARVWTLNTRVGALIGSAIDAGAVNINDGYGAAFTSYSAPAGGMKASVLGRRHGAAGLLRYTESKTVAVQRITSVDNRLGLPRRIHGSATAGAIRLLSRVAR